MKIMATFDGSVFSEAVLPQLAWMNALPDVEFTLFSVAADSGGELREGIQTATGFVPNAPTGGDALVVQPPDAQYAETKLQAVQRREAELADYLQDLAHRGAIGSRYTIKTCVSANVASAIIQQALKDQPDLIVMATHGETGVVHRLFGDVAEQVVRSGVAPVLLVPPDAVKHARVETHPA